MFIVLAQAIDLLCCIAWHGSVMLALLPYYLIRAVFYPEQPCENGQASFYEGHVMHVRRAPVHNTFRYPVRVVVISLDDPPKWFKHQAKYHLSASEARAFAGTRGKVELMTNPMTAGYTQNPISVYYCFKEGDGEVDKCIAEVTNTPWNERVRFCFDSSQTKVKKALHVSPMMDMKGTWILTAPMPNEKLKLVVKVEHPEYGKDFFHAELVASRSKSLSRGEGGLGMLGTYGFQPHRTALLIYMQALILISKGLPLYPLPSPMTKQHAAVNASHPKIQTSGAFFEWTHPPRWPWNAGGDNMAGQKCPFSSTKS
jgi:DUF1365 family protein